MQRREGDEAAERATDFESQLRSSSKCRPALGPLRRSRRSLTASLVPFLARMLSYSSPALLRLPNDSPRASRRRGSVSSRSNVRRPSFSSCSSARNDRGPRQTTGLRRWRFRRERSDPCCASANLRLVRRFVHVPAHPPARRLARPPRRPLRGGRWHAAPPFTSCSRHNVCWMPSCNAQRRTCTSRGGPSEQALLSSSQLAFPLSRSQTLRLPARCARASHVVARLPQIHARKKIEGRRSQASVLRPVPTRA